MEKQRKAQDCDEFKAEESGAAITRPEAAPTAKAPKSVGGLLLNGRALAKAAIHLSRYPGALRVLAVVHEYMDHHGRCWASSYTLADRLGMTRQAVQQHIARLVAEGIVAIEREDGHAQTFHWDDAWLDGLSDERAGQREAEARRAERRTERKSKRREASSELAPRGDIRVPEKRGEASSELAGGGKLRTCPRRQAQNLPEETLEETLEETPEGGVSLLMGRDGGRVERTGRVDAPSPTPNIGPEDGDPKLAGTLPPALTLRQMREIGKRAGYDVESSSALTSVFSLSLFLRNVGLITREQYAATISAARMGGEVG